MKIGICSDHAGVDYKARLIKYLERNGVEVVNFGTDSKESCDYPDYASRLADAIAGREVEAGIALCGTGNGMAITLNHRRGIIAGLAWNTAVAELVKRHNNANVLVIPARFVSYRMATAMVRTWMEASFEGGRHQRRLDKIGI